MEFTGKIIAILPIKTGVSKSGNNWAAQEYVIEQENVQFPESLCFQVFGQEKIDELHITSGESMKVLCISKAKQYNERYFNSFECWKVERVGNTQQSPLNNPQQQFPPKIDSQGSAEGKDDLPF